MRLSFVAFTDTVLRVSVSGGCILPWCPVCCSSGQINWLTDWLTEPNYTQPDQTWQWRAVILTFLPSSRLMTMAMRSQFCSQTMHQKSANVAAIGANTSVKRERFLYHEVAVNHHHSFAKNTYNTTCKRKNSSWQVRQGWSTALTVAIEKNEKKT